MPRISLAAVGMSAWFSRNGAQIAMFVWWSAGCLLSLGSSRTEAMSPAQADRQLGPSLPVANRGEPDLPDIVLFVVDDLGWQDTSVAFGSEPTASQAYFATPHVAQLARRGVRFANAYACPVCTPTRVSILTGQNAARHRVTNWTLYSDRETSGTTAVLAAPAAWRRDGVSLEQPLLPALLQARGYTTIHCGKAHWGAMGTPGSNPLNLGFQVNRGGHAAGAPGSYLGTDNFGNHPDGTWREPWGVPDLAAYHGQDVHLTDALVAEAKVALRAADPARPIFLSFAPYAVHTPLQRHARHIDPTSVHMYTNGHPIPEAEIAYRSMVAGVDAALGELLDELQRLGRASQTLIVFTSDNGGLSAVARGETWRGTGRDTHNWPLRAGKGSAYEGGIRVPLIMAWGQAAPDHPLQRRIPLQGDRRVVEPVICEDLFATIASWAGYSLTADLIAPEPIDAAEPGPAAPRGSHPQKRLRTDGIDLTPACNGGSLPAERELLFHYPHVWGPAGDGYRPYSALRRGAWKVIYFYDPPQWELYDLSNDLSEQHDLGPSRPATLRSMAEQLLGLLVERHALFPQHLQRGEPQRPQLPE